jgi:thioredoxin-related protein
MNNLDKEIPTIDLKLETKEVKSETRKLSSKYMVIEPPYFLFSEHGKEEIVKIWTKNNFFGRRWMCNICNSNK